MNKYIRKRLQEGVDSYQTQTQDKYGLLEQDLTELVQKHMEAFEQYPNDTYGVLDAIEQVFNGMFQRVEKN